MYGKNFNIAHDNLSLQRTREIIKIYNFVACRFCRLSHVRVLWAHFLRFPLILRKDNLTRHARTHALSLPVRSHPNAL